MATKKVNIDIIAKDKTRAAMRTATAGINNIKKSVFSLQTALVGLGAGVAVKSFIDVGRLVERLGVRFKFLFGSAREGAKAFDTLIKFAGRVPFTLEEIQGASGNLAVISKDAKELGKNLDIVGNVAAVTGLDFQTTAEQIQRAFAGGIASADIFREKGVRALLGFEEGARVSVEETRKRFFEVFGPNGEFGKATDELAKTFDGTLSMIGDKVFAFKNEVAQAGLFDFVKATAETINRSIEDNFGSIETFARSASEAMIKSFITMGIGVGKVADLFTLPAKVMVEGVKNVIGFLNSIPEPMRSLGVVGFLALGFKGKVAVTLISAFFDEIKSMAKFLGAETSEFLEKQNIELTEDLMDFLNNIGDESKKKFTEIGAFLNTSLDDIFGKRFGGAEKGLTLTIDVGFETQIRNFFAEVMKNFDKARNSAGDFGKTVGQEMHDALASQGMFNEELSLTDKIFKELNLASAGFAEGFKEAMKSAGDTTKQFQNIGKQAFTELKTMLTDFVMTGKLQFEDFARTITRMIVEALIGRAITAAVDKAIELFKMKSIRSALINVYEGATKAFAQGGIFGPVLAAGAIAFGLGLVGKMRGFEKGGRPPVGMPSIVGEKGPELFVPDQAGTVVPNNQLGMGKAVTVNFNINTVDARGFNELLVNSRGTIVNLINSAVNEKGKMAII